MIELASASAFSFAWRPEGGQWLLREGGVGQKAAPVRSLPFVVGRAWDCQLVLPDSPELARSTSRWHCHITVAGEALLLADGSLLPVPETGGTKPSISGTFLNGRRVGAPQPLSPGDELKVGPWTLAVREHREPSVAIDGVLERMLAGEPRGLVAGGPAAVQGFAQLHDLFQVLHAAHGTEECLLAVLDFGLARMPAAMVAAVLLDEPGGEARVRIAVQRGAGRVFDFRYSSGLLRRLPADRAFLLETAIPEGTASQHEEDISSGLVIPLQGPEGRLGALYMDNRRSGASFREPDLHLARALASVASLQLSLERQAFLSRLEQNMRQYFGPDVVRLIVEASRKGRPVGLGGREVSAAVLFADMAGFSAFSLERGPAEVTDFLSQYYQITSECIQRHGGHVDKFLGDGVMGVFGVHPLAAGAAAAGGIGGYAAQAVRAARDMITRWGKLSLSRWGRPVALRVGISTGRVVAGNVGYPGRMEYTVIGDAVNLAARLEKLALENGVAATDATRALAGAGFSWEDGGVAEVKGFGKVRLWRLRA